MKNTFKLLIIGFAFFVTSLIVSDFNQIFAQEVSFETFITSVKAGEFVLSKDVEQKFLDYIEDGDTDSALKIYRSYFKMDDAADEKVSVEETKVKAEDQAKTETVADTTQTDAADDEITEAAKKAEEAAAAAAKAKEIADEEANKAAEAEAKLKAEEEAKAAAETEAKAKAEAEAKLKAEAEAKAKLEATVAVSGDYHGLSAEDYTALCKMVQAEAPSEGEAGKMMVANVILNRVKSAFYPSSVVGVISARGQFTPYRTGRYNTVVPNAETISAVNRALDGENNAPGIYSFKSVRSSSKWSNKVHAFTYGNHMFYY